MTKIKNYVFVSLLAAAISGCSSTASNTTVMSAEQPTSLMSAVAEGNTSKVEDLISDGLPINVVTPDGTALGLALKNKQAYIAVVLLRAGADPNLVPVSNTPSPLMYAAELGDKRVVKVLLEAGADVNYVDSQGQSAVAKAAYKGDLQVAKALIKAGADVNITPGGQSLLMHIVNRNDLLLAQVLLDAGADVNFADANGLTALKVAQSRGFRDLEMLLRQSGARS